jgi:hypothetical protein
MKFEFISHSIIDIKIGTELFKALLTFLMHAKRVAVSFSLQNFLKPLCTMMNKQCNLTVLILVLFFENMVLQHALPECNYQDYKYPFIVENMPFVEYYNQGSKGLFALSHLLVVVCCNLQAAVTFHLKRA